MLYLLAEDLLQLSCQADGPPSLAPGKEDDKLGGKHANYNEGGLDFELVDVRCIGRWYIDVDSRIHAKRESDETAPEDAESPSAGRFWPVVPWSALSHRQSRRILGNVRPANHRIVPHTSNVSSFLPCRCREPWRVGGDDENMVQAEYEGILEAAGGEISTLLAAWPCLWSCR